MLLLMSSKCCGDLLFPAGVDSGESVGCGGVVTDGAVGIAGVAGVSVDQSDPAYWQDSH